MTTPHLDDEALSAALDGVASAAQEDHLSSCPQCRARVAQLAAVASAVGAPVLPRRPVDIDEAIARALNAALEAHGEAPPEINETTTAPAAGPARPPGPDQPVVADPVREPPVTVSAVKLGAGRSRQRHRRWASMAGGIAAAALVVGGVATVARLSSGAKGQRSATVAGPTITSTTVQLPVPASPGDLGDQSDPAAVARLVAGALSPPGAGAALGLATPSAESTSAVNSGKASPVGGDALPLACEAQGRAALGLTGDAVVRFSALLRWRGQPAVVVAYMRPDGADGLAGLVMRSVDCSILAVLPL